MKYAYYWLGMFEDKENGVDWLRGISANLRNEIEWEFNMENGEVNVLKGVAPADFNERLKGYIWHLKDEIESGHGCIYSDERRDYVAEQLTEWEMKREAYVVESKRA